MMDLWTNRNWTPMLLKETNKPFNSKDYLYEIKFDGTRAIIFVSPKEITIYNRRKDDITYLYPELASIKKLVKRKTIFDGEIIVMENGVPSFNGLQKRAHLKNKLKIEHQMKSNPVIFVCFDILYDNKNLTYLPLLERKKFLDKYSENDFMIKSKYLLENGKMLYQKITKLALEGIVAKKINSVYEISKRSSSWLKIKNLQTATFYICGYIEKTKNYVISVILGEIKEGNICYVGKATLGKKTKLYRQIKKQKPLSKSVFKDYDNKLAIFIKPSLNCKVNFMNWTKNHHLRQPIITDE